MSLSTLFTGFDLHSSCDVVPLYCMYRYVCAPCTCECVYSTIHMQMVESLSSISGISAETDARAGPYVCSHCV